MTIFRQLFLSHLAQRRILLSATSLRPRTTFGAPLTRSPVSLWSAFGVSQRANAHNSQATTSRRLHKLGKTESARSKLTTTPTFAAATPNLPGSSYLLIQRKPPITFMKHKPRSEERRV